MRSCCEIEKREEKGRTFEEKGQHALGLIETKLIGSEMEQRAKVGEGR